MDEKVSIIVPLYNMEKLIGKCLDSLKNQTYKNIEVVVIDDGSKDNSGMIADQYGKRDPRFKIIHHEVNKGIACAFITGLKNSTGKYVMFVDSDNYVADNIVETLVSVLKQTASDLVQCDTFCYTDEKEVATIEFHNRKIVELEGKEDIINDFLLKKTITNNLSSKLFQKKWLDEAIIPEGRQIVDIIIMLQMIDKCNKYVCINDPLYLAYMPEDSISRGAVTEGRVDDFVFANNFYKEFINKHWPAHTDFITYRTASVSLWAYQSIIESYRIEEKNKKDLKKKYTHDFAGLFKDSKRTVYYQDMPQGVKMRWQAFYYCPCLYGFALRLRALTKSH